MLELVSVTGVILSQASELMKNPAVKGAVSGMVDWIGNVLGKPSAKEKLKLIEENQHDESTIESLKSNLEFMLEDNQELQQQLSQKLKEIQEISQREGIKITTTTNTINITGDNNTTIQGVSSKGDINITR